MGGRVVGFWWGWGDVVFFGVGGGFGVSDGLL